MFKQSITNMLQKKIKESIKNWIILKRMKSKKTYLARAANFYTSVQVQGGSRANFMANAATTTLKTQLQVTQCKA